MATQAPPPQINNVPPGFNWKVAAAGKAGEAGKFLYVGGGKEVTKRALSGAKRYWQSDDPNENTIIYNTRYRITGTPANVAQALRYQGYPEADIAAALADSITRDNYATTKRDAVAAELASAQAAAAKKPAKATPYRLVDYLWFAKNLPKAQIITKATGAATGAAAAGTRRKGRDTIAEKFQKLAAGKVLDVSAIDYATGDGATVRTATQKSRTGRQGTKNLAIVSNNVQNYQRAIELIFGPQGLQTYAADIQMVARAIADAGQAQAAAPAATVPVPVPAAPVVPGATIAPPVTIGGFPVVQ
jgi:hypothetical protein